MEQHSTYASDPWARLFRTVDVMLKLTFGTSAFFNRDVLKEKVRTVTAHGVYCMPGGTLQEVAIWQGALDRYLDRARELGFNAIEVSDDRLVVELELPAAELFGARIDPQRSYVYDRDRGLIDRVASLFQDSPTSERELYLLAEQKLTTAAREDAELLERAERNTRQMLTGMLRALGFERIVVRFEPA